MKEYRIVLPALLLALSHGSQTYLFAQSPSDSPEIIEVHPLHPYASHVSMLEPPAEEFIKSDPVQCWLDAKEVVHRHAASESIVDEASHSIKIDRYNTPTQGGPPAILVRASADTDKKKGTGCRLYVAIIRQGFTLEIDGRDPAWQAGSLDVNLVHQIAGEVVAMQKEREKKAKKP